MSAAAAWTKRLLGTRNSGQNFRWEGVETYFYRGADKSLTQPGRKQANFCKPLKKNSEGCPSNQVSAAAMISASDEKWQPFNCFFSRVGLRTYQHPCT